MKKNCWLFLGAMLSTSLLAQQVTNSPPAAPTPTEPPAAAAPATAPAATSEPAATSTLPEAPPSSPAKTNAPAAKAEKKKSATKKKSEKKAVTKKKSPVAELKTVPLVAGPAVVEANNVNVRGKPGLKGEVVTHVTKGQSVTVLEEIVRNNSGPDEPSAWAKILLPTNVHVWINTEFIDAANKTVKPKKLNLRSGPGENYSVLGLLLRGDAVNTIGTKGDWTEIEAPTNAYAFVAAQYLKQEPPGAIAAATPAEPATVSDSPALATATTDVPGATNATAETSGTTNAPTEPAAEEPPPKRIVQREGVVRGTISIQAPSHFELVSPDNGRTIDYLYTTSPNLDLRRYKGLRIIVTGEEGLDERWGNTPIITIQKIQVLE